MTLEKTLVSNVVLVIVEYMKAIFSVFVDILNEIISSGKRSSKPGSTSGGSDHVMLAPQNGPLELNFACEVFA